MKTCRTNRREQIIEQILFVECSQRYSQHVNSTLERFKRPAAVKKIDYTYHLLPTTYYLPPTTYYPPPTTYNLPTRGYR